MYNCKLLDEKAWRPAYALFVQLDSTIDSDSFMNVMAKSKDSPLALFGLYENDELRSVAASQTLEFVTGSRILWITHMVTHEAHRSRGLGKKLLQFIETFAAQNSYAEVRVHSKDIRHDAHRFYESKGGYRRFAVVFQKEPMIE